MSQPIRVWDQLQMREGLLAPTEPGEEFVMSRTGPGGGVDIPDTILSAFCPGAASVSASVVSGPIDTVNANRLYVIGDSRAQHSTRWWKNAILLSPIGRTVGIGCPDPIATGNGTLEYDPVLGFRWAANGDTAGPWTTARVGYITLESGSANKRVTIGVPSFVNFPATYTSVQVNVTGVTWLGYKGEGVASWALKHLGNSLEMVCLGFGGASAEDADAALADYWASQIRGGYTVLLLSTNDISAYTNPDVPTLLARLRRLYDKLLATGTKLVLVGESARYFDYPALTELGAGRKAAVLAVNALQREYAKANPGRVLHADILGISANQTNLNLAPKSRFLKDHVHYSIDGAQRVGQVVAGCLNALGAPIKRRAFAGLADESCWKDVGSINGTSGTLSTGASGVAAKGLTINRASGTDATVVGSIVTGSDGLGDWQKIVCSATSTGILQIRTTTAETLASLGLAAGNKVQFASEISVANSVNLRSVQFFALVAGVSHYVYGIAPIEGAAFVAGDHSAVIHESPIYTIPSGATTITLFVYVDLAAGGSAEVQVRNLERRIIA